jgi:hypothetical protein
MHLSSRDHGRLAAGRAIDIACRRQRAGHVGYGCEVLEIVE